MFFTNLNAPNKVPPAEDAFGGSFVILLVLQIGPIPGALCMTTSLD
jgi:hypothetical protein